MLSDSIVRKFLWLAVVLACCGWYGLRESVTRRLSQSPVAQNSIGEKKAVHDTESAHSAARTERAKNAIRHLTSTQKRSGSDGLVETVLRVMEDAVAQGGKLKKPLEMEIINRMSRASLEELTAMFAELDASVATAEIKDQIECLLYQEMARKNVEVALENGLCRIFSAPHNVRKAIYGIFKDWAWKTPDLAAAWLDKQIAEGRLEELSSDGKNRQRNGFETAIWDAYLAWGKLDLLDKRYDAAPERVRDDVMYDLSIEALRERDEKKFIAWVNTKLTPKQKMDAFSRLTYKLAKKRGYEGAALFIEEIKPTPNEAERYVGYTSRSRIYSLSCNGPITDSDFSSAVAWVRKYSPDNFESITGSLLGLIAETRTAGKYEESMHLLENLKSDPQRDQIVSSFIRYLHLQHLKKQSLPLVDTIGDSKLREETGKYLNRSLKEP